MYSIVNENRKSFLKIRSHGGCTSIVTRCIAVAVYPVFNWRWSVNTFPTGAVENVRKRPDNAAGVYIIFSGTLKLNVIAKHLCGISFKKGTITESPYNPRLKIISLKFGDKGNTVGIWINEPINVTDDSVRVFHSKLPLVDAIAMSDADIAKSVYNVDYDDFWISKVK